MTYRIRGPLNAKGPHIVAGVITGEQLLNGRIRDLVNDVPVSTIAGYRTAVFDAIRLSLSHGTSAVSPPRGTRVTPDALHPTQPSNSAGRPALIAHKQSGTPNPLVSTTQRRSVQQPGLPDTTAPAAPQHSEGA